MTHWIVTNARAEAAKLGCGVLLGICFFILLGFFAGWIAHAYYVR